jgi:hypothetical protein
MSVSGSLVIPPESSRLRSAIAKYENAWRAGLLRGERYGRVSARRTLSQRAALFCCLPAVFRCVPIFRVENTTRSVEWPQSRMDFMAFFRSLSNPNLLEWN